MNNTERKLKFKKKKFFLRDTREARSPKTQQEVEVYCLLVHFKSVIAK